MSPMGRLPSELTMIGTTESGVADMSDTSAEETDPLSVVPAIQTLPMKKTKRSFGLYWTLLLTTGVRGLSASGSIVLSIVLARSFNKSNFGSIALCLTSITALSMLARYGVDATLLRFGGAAWHANEISRFRGFAWWAFELVIRNSIAITVVGWLVYASGMLPGEASELMKTFILCLLPWSLVYTISFVFKASSQSHIGSAFEAGTVSLILVAGLLVSQFMGVTLTAQAIAWMLIGSASLLCFIGFIWIWQCELMPRHCFEIDPQRHEFNSSCRDVVLISLFQMLANWGGTFVLYYTWDDVEVANFAGPARFAMVSSLFINIVLLVLGPRLSGTFSHEGKEQFQELADQGSRSIFFVTFPVVVGIMVSAPWLVLLLGEQYAPAWPIISIVSAGQLLGMPVGLSPSVLVMTGLERVWRRASLVTTCLCIVWACLLCWQYGAVGAAIGMATYQAVYNWAAAIMVYQYRGFWCIANPIRNWAK